MASYGGGAPYRSRDGLSTRSTAGGGGGSDEIQVQIDPLHSDLDDKIAGLRTHVRRLKNVAQEIETEAKFQNDFIGQLQMTLIKAEAGVKSNIRRLKKNIIQNGSNTIVHVVVFAIVCFFIVYVYSKMSRILG